MKLCLPFLIITGCTLLYHVSCYEDVYRISERRSKVDVESIVPKYFMDRIDEYIKQTGYQTIKGQTIDLKENRHVFELIVSKIRDETLELLDKFTVLIVAMVERNKDMTSLESVLIYIKLNISKLSRCLEFLYDNGADVTDALTEYIFFSDLKYMFNKYFGANYTYKNIIDIMSVRITKKQWQEYLKQVPTQEIYKKLYSAVDKSLEDIYKVYQKLIFKPSLWLSPQSLKWRHLFESNSNIADNFKHLIAVDNENIFNQYLPIANEFDSTKVVDFYVKVGKVLDNIVIGTAVEFMKSLLYLILRLIEDFSNIKNSFTQINRAQRIISIFLNTEISFGNWMFYSKRLENTKKIHSHPAIKMLQEIVSYCQQYNLNNFPTVLAPFLYTFKKILKIHFPDIELDLAKITNYITENSVTQISIIESMEITMKLVITLIEEIASTKKKVI